MRYVENPYVKLLNQKQKKLLATLPYNPIDLDNHQEKYRITQWVQNVPPEKLPNVREKLVAIKEFIHQAKDDELLAPYALLYLSSLWHNTSTPHTTVETGVEILRIIQPLNEDLNRHLNKTFGPHFQKFKYIPWGSSTFGIQESSIREILGKDEFERSWLTTVGSTCSTFMLYKKCPEAFVGYEPMILRHMALQLAKPKARREAIKAISYAFDMEPEHEEYAHDLLMRALSFEPYDSYITVQLEKTGITPEMMFLHLGPLDEMVNFQLGGMKDIGISGTRFISFFRFMEKAMDYCSATSHREWLLTLSKGAESMLRANSPDADEIIKTLKEKLADDLPLPIIACLHAKGEDQSERLSQLGSSEQGQAELKQWLKETRLRHDQIFSVCLAANYNPQNAKLRKAKTATLRQDLEL